MGDIELQQITENAVESMKDSIAQLETPQLKYFLRQFLGLDKVLRSIRGLLRVEMAVKVQLEECIKGKSTSSQKSMTTQNTMMAFKKTSGKGSKG